VDRVECTINGSLIGTIEGEENTYVFRPQNLSDGILEIEVRAYNDLDYYTSQTITAVKGEPCSGDGDCKPNEICDAGKCVVPPPTGELGDPCQDGSECVSGLCPARGDEKLCSQWCNIFGDNTCGDGFDCIETSPTDGACWPADGGGGGGGCCAIATAEGRDDDGPLAPALLALGVLGLTWRRRGPTRRPTAP
jgi:hypothetical protein